MGTDADTLKQRARRLYELGRLRGALGWSIPALILAALVALVVRQASIPLAIGVTLYAASVGLLWWGRAPGRGVLPGLVFGLVPLVAALVANFLGHASTGSSCLQICTFACFGGGLVAGLLIARVAVRSPNPLALFLSAASVAFLTGVIGGACMGVYPVIGMAVAIAAGLLPVALRSRLHAP
ncbi:MAG TPA: hypothetical protein VHB68_09255 [Steroidobacteraceae bacterium]|nr:hypothetical protein [Steroidobacteraceae bacterium]